MIAAVPCLLLLAPAAAVASALALFAAIVRAAGSRLEPPFMTWRELIAFDARLGWTPRPNLDGHYMAVDDDLFRIVTDAEGWPGRRPLDESDVVAIGDSFAFGYGIDAGRSFADIDPALRVKAVGAPGYSMVHGVRLMEHFGRRLEGKLVVWLAFLENDLQDNLSPEMRGYRAPFVRANDEGGGWTIVDRHVRPEKWSSSALDVHRLFPLFCVPGAAADRAFEACDYLIARARAACRQGGATLVLVTVPHPMQLSERGLAALASKSGRPGECDPSLPDRRIAESCRRLGVPLVVGREYLRHTDYKRREGIHWNARGHRKIAQLLRQLHDACWRGELNQYVPDGTDARGRHGVTAGRTRTRPAPAPHGVSAGT